jgi:hypothetical protein
MALAALMYLGRILSDMGILPKLLSDTQYRLSCEFVRYTQNQSLSPGS